MFKASNAQIYWLDDSTELEVPTLASSILGLLLDALVCKTCNIGHDINEPFFHLYAML